MRRRGMTLLEAVIALLVMTTALAAIFGMINHVQSANRSLSFQNTALDAFAQISAQIRDARCDFPAGSDPALLVPATTDAGIMAGIGGFIGLAGPEPGSGITFVGNPTTNPQMALYTPPIAVDYEVTPEPPPDPTAAPSFQVDVRIREWTRDPNLDNPALTDGAWIRVFPVQKVCNPRIDAQGRGEY